MNYLKINSFIFLTVLVTNLLKAAPPNWNVNAALYQYSMTVTAVSEVNCTELTNPSNQIGAFVNGQLRGSGFTSNVINGKYIATLTIYSNSTSGEKVSFKFYNTLNDSTYIGLDSIIFQDNAAYGSVGSPFVVKNNYKPTVLNLSNNNINEGQPVNTLIGLFSSVDFDANETFTYSLVSGAGSTDNNNFSISGNELRSAAIFNFLNKPNHSIRIRTTDANGCSYDQSFNIVVTDVNTPPTAIFISDSAVNENSSSLTIVGTLSALDSDVGETFSYALVSGSGSTDNSLFNINGNALRTSAPFNFEVKSSYQIRIRVTDLIGNTYERPLTILVDDMNDAPTNVLVNGSNTGISFAENKPLGSLIGLFSTIDEDAANSYNYTFVNTPGNDNSFFTIAGDQLRTGSFFDYESRQSYVVFVQTNDGNGGLFTKQFVLTVSDSNDIPTSISISNNSISENLAAGTPVGKFTTTDPDGNGTFIYTLVGGANSGGNSFFHIGNDTLYTSNSFDYEANTNFNVRVNVNDGSGGNLQQVFNMSILNTNDAPSDLNITTNQIPENQPANTVIGSISSVDQDAGNTFVYSLVTGAGSTDNNSFNISGNNLRSSVTFDFEMKNSYSIRIRSTDNFGGFTEKNITIEVTNVNDAPTNLVISADTISENQPLNTLIGTLSSISQDPGITYTYSFNNNIPGNDNANFVISGNQLRSNLMFDYENKSTYQTYVTASDGVNTFTKNITISVINRNDAPNDIILSANYSVENLPLMTFIGKLTSSDPDNSLSFNYQLISGVGSSDNTLFYISNDSLFTNQTFNYEIKSSYSIRIKTTDDGGSSFQKIFTIGILNANDIPENISISETTVNENISLNTNIGQFTTTDQDSGSIHYYSLVPGNGSTDNGHFVISGNQLRNTSLFDFESKNNYAIRVRTTDNQGGFFEKEIIISINNQNDAPTNITLSNDSVTENLTANHTIGLLSTTDQDVANSFIYSFANTSGNNNDQFVITGNQLKTAVNFNYEQKSLYFIYITTNDGNGATYTKQFQINIKDTNDAPTDIALSSPSIAENRPANTYIGTFSSTDPDQNNTFNYQLSTGTGSNDNSYFSISNDSLYTTTLLNFETQNSYSIRVKSTDNGGLNFQKSFTISVGDSNDMPTAIQLSANQVNENVAIGTTIGTFSTSDVDVGQTHSYSLVGGAGSANNNHFVINGNTLKTNAIFNYESKSAYTIRVQTNDGNGGTFTDTFNIIINNANDYPTQINLSNQNIKENKPAGSLIGELATVDEDLNTFTYSLPAGGLDDNALFIINGNQLKSNHIFNFESKSVYSINVVSNDGNGGSFSKQFLITILDSNDAPTDIQITNQTLAENQPMGTFIGKLSASDVDANLNNGTYQLVNGVGSTHNNLYTISNDSLFSATSFNFEQQANFSIRIKYTDEGNLGTEKVFVIQVSDNNDTPTQLSLSNNNFNENRPTKSIIGILSTTDADANSAFTYLLVNGIGSTHNSLFTITNNELKTNALFNYEILKTCSIRIQTQDNAGATFEQFFVLQINDSNDAPTDITLSNLSFKENKTLASIVGNLTTTDEDTISNFVYSFENILGNDNSAFFISGNQLRTNQLFDYETKQVYNIYIKTNDGLASYIKQFIINITDSNDAPTGISISNNQINENELPLSFIGTIYTTDVDINDQFTYSLVSGSGSTNNNFFTISNDTLYSNATFNFEVKNSYSIRIRSTDASLAYTESLFNITILNNNDAPTNITLSNTDISENKTSRSKVATISTTDADADQFTYSLISGAGDTDNGSFLIQGDELLANRSFNYEQQNTFFIRIQTNDKNGGSFEKAFTISVLDSNDAPSNILLSTNVVAENAPIGRKVCDLSTTDQDAGDGFNYSFINLGVNNNDKFLIVGNELRTNQVFDFESKNFYIVQIQSADAAGSTVSRQFVIDIKDSVDAPNSLEISSGEIEENKPAGAFIGNFNTTDPDQFANFNYTLVSGLGANNNNSFVISNDSLLTNENFNYESKKSYTIRVRTTDITNAYFEKIFNINITDANDAPTQLQLSNNKISENAAVLSLVGTFSTTDPDVTDAFNYSLVSGSGNTDNGSFIISNNQLYANFSGDFENKNSYSIRVQTKDSGGDSIENIFVIQILDVSEKPTINNQSFSVSENELAGFVFGTVTATSPDANANLKYYLPNQNQFFLDENTGELALVNQVDYEKQNNYTFVVIVKDEQPTPLYDTATISIDVKDEIETKQELPANNFVSPNGDGVNDYFSITTPELYKDFSLTVYNENGLQVYFIANNYQNNWDCSYNGKLLSTGTYFYVLYNPITKATFKGSINIINN